MAIIRAIFDIWTAFCVARKDTGAGRGVYASW